VPRRPDPTRKPELLGQIIEHLRGRSIASVSFRTLADALGVSTYVFVYHFGNRAELVAEIVRGVLARHDAALGVDPAGLDAPAFRAHLLAVLEDERSARGLDLLRLETEAALLELVAGEQGPARAEVVRWHTFVAGWLVGQGVPEAVAGTEARIVVDALRGLQHDALVTGEVHPVATAVARLLDEIVERVPGLASQV
jgi:AcrR family transcriptional regulator